LKTLILKSKTYVRKDATSNKYYTVSQWNIELFRPDIYHALKKEYKHGTIYTNRWGAIPSDYGKIWDVGRIWFNIATMLEEYAHNLGGKILMNDNPKKYSTMSIPGEIMIVTADKQIRKVNEKLSKKGYSLEISGEIYYDWEDDAFYRDIGGSSFPSHRHIEKLPYIQKFADNIRTNGGGTRIIHDPANDPKTETTSEEPEPEPEEEFDEDEVEEIGYIDVEWNPPSDIVDGFKCIVENLWKKGDKINAQDVADIFGALYDDGMYSDEVESRIRAELRKGVGNTFRIFFGKNRSIIDILSVWPYDVDGHKMNVDDYNPETGIVTFKLEKK